MNYEKIKQFVLHVYVPLIIKIKYQYVSTRAGEKYPPPASGGSFSSLASYFQNQPAHLAGKISDLG